jgi:hypothetical protein
LGPLKINLQFLEHHQDQFLELHRELIKTNYAPQTNAALQNLKTLLEPEISLLISCDIEWGGEPEVEAPVAEAGAILGASVLDENEHNSSEKRPGLRCPASIARGNPLDVNFAHPDVAGGVGAPAGIHVSGTTCSVHGLPPFTPSSVIQYWRNGPLRALTHSALINLVG